jgi:hypothetical protein
MAFYGIATQRGSYETTDDAVATDEHRALNYCALHYPEIYVDESRRMQEDCSSSAVEVRPSRLSGVRRVVDVIFTYTNPVQM